MGSIRTEYVQFLQKKKSTWRIHVWYCDTDLNTVHGCDCVRWATCTYAKSRDGNSCVPNLWQNDGKRNLDRNRWGNEWNDRNRFLCVRNSISFIERPRSGRSMFSCVHFLLVASSLGYAIHQASYLSRATSHSALHTAWYRML